MVEGEERAEVRTIPMGAGKVIWCPLPVEAGAESAPVAALYRFASKQADVAPVFSVRRGPIGADPAQRFRALRAVHDHFGVGQQKQIELTHLENGARISVSLPPQRAAHVLINRKSGRILGQLLPE